MTRPRLLILSFSPLLSDARVLKQIRLFTPLYDVVTCGYGEAPEGVVEHWRIPDELVSGRYDGKPLRLRAYRWAYWHHPVVAHLRRTLPVGTMDAILADDIDTGGLALHLRPRHGVHADLHEYAPRMNEHLPAWNRWVRPFMSWMVRRYVRRCASVTAVAPHIAEEYQRRFRLRHVGVVVNAAPYHDLAPTPVGEPLRLVHSGAARSGRRIEDMIEAVAGVPGLVMDLYLTQNSGPYYAGLLEQAERAENVRILPPVPYAQLIDTLHDYDVGVFSLPPTTFNYEWALPNKVYDFVQARLALVISPSPEMARLVREHELGVVADGFAPADLRRALASLDPSEVARAKRASDAAALPLSAERSMDGWREAIADLLGPGSPRP